MLEKTHRDSIKQKDDIAESYRKKIRGKGFDGQDIGKSESTKLILVYASYKLLDWYLINKKYYNWPIIKEMWNIM